MSLQETSVVRCATVDSPKVGKGSVHGTPYWETEPKFEKHLGHLKPVTG